MQPPRVFEVAGGALQRVPYHCLDFIVKYKLADPSSSPANVAMVVD